MPQTSVPVDSFTEPYTRLGDDVSLEEVRERVRALENEHRANGVTLSGRILHVCHYLPITSTLTKPSKSGSIGVISPPATPPSKPSEVPGEPSSPITPEPSQPISSIWTLSPRYGHAAMISGIRSLATTHEQLIIGWTGDVHSTTPGENIPEENISEEDKKELEEALLGYQPKETGSADLDDEKDEKKTTYVPVWMPGKVAHGHYDGYCKQSKIPILFSCIVIQPVILVLWPLFHYLLWQDVATEYASADSHYPFYEAANAAFARRICEVYRPGDLIWIHDYHLLLLPKMVREHIPEVILGLFVHTPFPSSEVFRCLPSEYFSTFVVLPV